MALYRTLHVCVCVGKKDGIFTFYVPRNRLHIAKPSMNRVASGAPALPPFENSPAQAPPDHAVVARVRRGGRGHLSRLRLLDAFHRRIVRFDNVINIRLGRNSNALRSPPPAYSSIIVFAQGKAQETAQKSIKSTVQCRWVSDRRNDVAWLRAVLREREGQRD